MNYKLAPHVTAEMLEKEGFCYRSWYGNFNFLITCPDFEKQLKHVMSLGYTQEQALEQDSVKQAQIDYYIQIDEKKRDIEIYTHALNSFPYEVLNHQHGIAHEVIAKMVDLIQKGYVIENG